MLVAGVVMIATLVMLLLLIGLQAVNPLSPKEWTYPSWATSFLPFGQPLPFFHFGAFYFGAIAAGALVAHLVWGAQSLWLVGMGLGVGLGAWLAVLCSWQLFRWKHPSSGKEGV